MAEPTNSELSQLKDEIELFKQGHIWQHILRYMQEMYATVAEEALSAEEDRPGAMMAKVKWASGVAHAVKMIAAFDEHIVLFKKAKESE